MKKLFAFVIALLFVVPAFATDVWLNPGPYPEGKDTWFGSTNYTTAQHDYRLRVGGTGNEYDTLLRFDLSGLPQTATQVVLWMYPINEGATTNIYWDVLNTQWQSSTVGWSNKPTGTNIGVTVAPIPGSWYGVIFTNQYNQWRSGNLSTLNYGLKLRPVSTVNNYSSFYSSTQSYMGPRLQISYTTQSDDSKIKLKWPLATVKPGSPSSAFGDYWGVGITKCAGLPMTHTGVDIPNAIGNAVYAAEDSVVKEILSATQTGGWAGAIVLEHNHPVSGKYTTVYWHVTPASGVVVAPAGQAPTFIPKGMQIATIANIYPHGSHLHFGVRTGAYNSTYSDKGALPTNYCSQLPTFQENFINPWDVNQVLFQ